jgi:hypothetical protein
MEKTRITLKSIEGKRCYNSLGERFRLPKKFETTEVPFTAIIENSLVRIPWRGEMIEVPTVVDIVIGCESED